MNWTDGKKYEFDICDLTTLISVVAVILTLMGYALVATIIFVLNCCFQIVWTIAKTKRYNLLILNLALLVFNLSFII